MPASSRASQLTSSRQPVLGIDANGLAGRDAEELGVELVHAFEKPAPARIHLAGRGGIGIVVVVDVPAFRRNFPHGIHALAQEPPEGLRSVALARKAAAHPHHGDRLGLRVFVGRQPGLCLLEQVDGILQWCQAGGLRTAISIPSVSCACCFASSWARNPSRSWSVMPRTSASNCSESKAAGGSANGACRQPGPRLRRAQRAWPASVPGPRSWDSCRLPWETTAVPANAPAQRRSPSRPGNPCRVPGTAL